MYLQFQYLLKINLKLKLIKKFEVSSLIIIL